MLAHEHAHHEGRAPYWQTSGPVTIALGVTATAVGRLLRSRRSSEPGEVPTAVSGHDVLRTEWNCSGAGQMDCREGARTAILQLGRARKINLQFFEVSVVLGCWCMGLSKSLFLDHFLEGCPCPGAQGSPREEFRGFRDAYQRGKRIHVLGSLWKLLIVFVTGDKILTERSTIVILTSHPIIRWFQYSTTNNNSSK